MKYATSGIMFLKAKSHAAAKRRRSDMGKSEDIFCPVCGYYCLGKGGVGCIDKPFYVERITAQPRRVYDGEGEG